MAKIKVDKRLRTIITITFLAGILILWTGANYREGPAFVYLTMVVFILAFVFFFPRLK